MAFVIQLLIAEWCWFFICVLFFMFKLRPILYFIYLFKHFLQPEAYVLHFWCGRIFKFAKNITFFLIKNRQAVLAQVRLKKQK